MRMAATCSIPCDPDCPAKCHAVHMAWQAKEHPDFWCQLGPHPRELLVHAARSFQRQWEEVSEHLS